MSSSLNNPSPSLSSSQTSPIPSPSRSDWSALAISTQLSSAFNNPSPSISSSQTSPIPSPSISLWSSFETSGQLSISSLIPSPSLSLANINLPVDKTFEEISLFDSPDITTSEIGRVYSPKGFDSITFNLMESISGSSSLFIKLALFE